MLLEKVRCAQAIHTRLTAMSLDLPVHPDWRPTKVAWNSLCGRKQLPMGNCTDP